MKQMWREFPSSVVRHWPVFVAGVLAVALAFTLDSLQRRLAQERQNSLVAYELGIVRSFIDDQTSRAIARGAQIAGQLERLDVVGESEFWFRVRDLLAPELGVFNATWAPDFKLAYSYAAGGAETGGWSDLTEDSVFGDRLEKMLTTWGVVSEIRSQNDPSRAALVLRFAVENQASAAAQLSGVFSIEIPFSALLQGAVLERPDAQIDVVVGSIDGIGGSRQIVAGSEYLRLSGAAIEKVSLPGSTLSLLAIPKGGWQVHPGANVALRLGLVFLCAMIAALTFWANRSAMGRAAATRARESAEGRLGGVLANLPGAAIVYTLPPRRVDPSSDDKIVFLNKDSCKKIWGVEADIAERDVSVLWATGDDDEAIAALRSEITNATTEMRPYFAVWPIRTPAGQRKWLEGRGQPTRLDDGSVRWISTIYDVTEQVERKAELDRQSETIFEAQKQESIGQLTGGVAHDFNNLLAVIMGNLELMRDDIVDPELIGLIDVSINATKRGADLTRNMLAFAKKSQLQPVVIDLNDLVRDAGNWIGRTLPSNIAIDTDLAPGTPFIEADPSSVESALLNLIVNARDAMPNGGKLLIETRSANIDADDAAPLDFSPGQYVVLCLSDSGEGIPRENLAKIFEPFFSTKPTGKGSGLGLSMIAGFMQQSGGAVEVESEPGEGTKFRLFFPASEKSRGLARQEGESDKDGASRGARILLAEDDNEVRSVLIRNLERVGYDVTATTNGDNALAIFEGDQAYDLLLTDIVMPGDLQGDDLGREVHKLRPDIPVVFMSGYSPDIAAIGEEVFRNDAWLTKPVQREELLETVSRLLEERKS